MSTVPTVPEGAKARRAVSEMTRNHAAVVPKVTPVAPVRLLPVTVTTEPPAALPEEGVMPVTEGVEALLYVNWSDELVADVPEKVVTVTWTVPAAWGGLVAMICVAETTVNAAVTSPNFTSV